MGLAAIGFSAYAMRAVGGDFIEMGAAAGLFFMMLMPGLLLLGTLLQPRTIRWFRQPHQAAPSAPSPPLPPPPAA